MTLQQQCADRRKKLGLTHQDIADQSNIPVSTVKKFFSESSKAPSFYVVAGICKELGVSMDAWAGLEPRFSASEETLQAKAEGLERQLDEARETVSILKDDLSDLRQALKLYRVVVLILSAGILLLGISGVWRG